jgi:hypothetical protein
MKLEMRVFDLDIKLELADGDNFDNFEILTTIKKLVDNLAGFDNVNLSVVSNPEENSQDLAVSDFDDPDDIKTTTQWGFPESGLDSLGAEVEPVNYYSDKNT